MIFSHPTSAPKDDRDMSDKDVLREVAELVYGAAAEELIVKAQLTPEEKKARNREIGRKIGFGTNALGAVAGPAAIWQATKAAKEKKGGIPRDAMRSFGTAKIKRMAHSLDNATGKKGKYIALGTGAGLIGLQTANWVGDAVAAHTLSADKKDPVKQKKIKVAKSNPDQTDLHVPSAKGVLVRQGVKHAPEIKRAGGKLTAMANQKVKEITKSAESEIVWEGEFSKVDSDRRQVFGWASIVKKDGEDIVDLQGDYISIDEIEKSAYDYVVKSRKGGNQHLRDGEAPVHVSDMIESFIVTPEKIEKMGLPETTPLGWWVGYQINDDQTWQQVKSGERTGFSIHGRGLRKEIA